MTVQTKIMEVTPALAEKWLLKNTRNRRPKMAKVAGMVRNMRDGRWTLSESAICFDEAGTLTNGQNRLTAIIESGVTITSLVMTGMPPEAFVNFDSGSSRTPSDVLYVESYKDVNALAAAAKLVMTAKDGTLGGTDRDQMRTPFEILEFVEKNPLLQDSVRAATIARKESLGPGTPLAGIHFLLMEKVGTAIAGYFLSQIAYGAEEPKGSAVLALRSAYSRMRRESSYYKSRDHLVMLSKAWNIYAVDGRVRHLEIRPRGDFVLPELVSWQREFVPTEDNSQTRYGGH